jgi:outer membrane protein TolC
MATLSANDRLSSPNTCGFAVAKGTTLPRAASFSAMFFRFSSLLAPPLWRGCVLAISSFFGGVALTAQQLPISLPEELLPELREILVRAASQAPNMQAANIESARLEASYITSRSVLLPGVHGSASYNWSTSEVKDMPLSESKSDGLFYSFGASQPIFHWGALKAQTDISKLEVLIGEQDTAETYRTMALTLRSQYLTLILKKLALRNQQFAQKVAEDFLAVQEERLRNRSISEGAIHGPRLNAEEARYYTMVTEQDFDSSVRVFARLAGQPEFNQNRVPDLLPRPEFSGEVLSAYFRQLSSEVIRDMPLADRYELRILQEEKRYHIERTRLLPKFSANVSYGVSNITNASPTTVSQTAVVSTSASIGASWTLFDGLASRGGKLAALAAKRLNERYLDTYLESTMHELRSLQGNIEATGKLMDIRQRQLDLAWSAVQQAKQDLQLGRASQPDVDNITNNAYRAEVQTANARSAFLNAWAQYVSLVGADPMMEHVSRSPVQRRR